MSECFNSCNLNVSDNTDDVIIKRLQIQIKELCKTTTAKLLLQDEKIAEICMFIHDNLSNELRELLDTMRYNGELKDIINDIVLSEINELKEITKHIVTPQMYGAYGDGKHNDSAAFNKALTMSKYVHIPRGTYLLNDTINLVGGEVITGEKDTTLVNGGSVLFNITSYYDNATVLDNFIIDANGKPVIKANRGSWGVSYTVKNLTIKNCGDKAIVNSEGFNVRYLNTVFQSKSDVKGTLIVLCDSAAKTFSNVISFDGCVISGNSNMTLVDCTKSFRVNAYDTTFTSCNIAIKGEMLCVGCWFETANLCSTAIKTKYVECHFADIKRMSASNYSDNDIQSTPAFINNPYFNADSGSVLDEVYSRASVPLFRPVVGGYVNGVYQEFLPFQIYSNKLISNIPINTYYKEGTGNTLYLACGDLASLNKGTFFVEIEGYRNKNGSIVQKSTVKGILKNNTFTQLDKTDSDTTYPARFGWDTANQMFSVTDFHEGTLIARLHIERVSM